MIIFPHLTVRRLAAICLLNFLALYLAGCMTISSAYAGKMTANITENPTTLPTLTSIVLLSEVPVTPTLPPSPSPSPTLQASATPPPGKTALLYTPTSAATSTPVQPKPAVLPALDHLAYISLTNASQITRLAQIRQSHTGGFATSRDGRWLAQADGAYLRLFDLRAGGAAIQLPGGPGDFSSGLAINATGKRVAAVDGSLKVRAWIISDQGGQMAAVEGPDYAASGIDSLTQLVYTPDGRRLLGLGSQANQPKLIVWDTASGEVLGLSPAGSDKDPLLVSPNGFLALQPGRDGTLRFWYPTTGRSLGQQIIYACPDSLVGAAFSPDGHLLALQCDGDLSRIYFYQPNYYQPEALTLIRVLDSGVPGDGQIAINRDGGILAAAEGTPPRQVVLWNLIRKERFYELNGFESVIHRVSVSPDGKLLIIQLVDGTLELWGVSRR